MECPASPKRAKYHPIENNPMEPPRPSPISLHSSPCPVENTHTERRERVQPSNLEGIVRSPPHPLPRLPPLHPPSNPHPPIYLHPAHFPLSTALSSGKLPPIQHHPTQPHPSNQSPAPCLQFSNKLVWTSGSTVVQGQACALLARTLQPAPPVPAPRVL